MPILPLLAALAIAPTTDFDGLTVGGLAPVGEPTVNGQVKSWLIPNEVEIEGKKIMMGSATVTITDISEFPQKPTADQVMNLHFRGMTQIPNCFGINLSRYKAKLGDNPVALTFGSMILPAGGGGYTPGYACSFATLVGNKVYEVAKFRTSGPYSELDFTYLKNCTFKQGDKTLTVSEYPEIWSQAFEIIGAPFQLDWNAVPNPLLVSADPAYDANYSAWSYFENWNADYELRKLKTSATFEPEAFIKGAFVNRLKDATVTVSDIVKTDNQDRWTANVVFEFESGRAQRGKVEILKKDLWVGAQLLRGTTTLPAVMDEKFKIAFIK